MDVWIFMLLFLLKEGWKVGKMLCCWVVIFDSLYIFVIRSVLEIHISCLAVILNYKSKPIFHFKFFNGKIIKGKKLFNILVLLCLWNILEVNVFKNNSKLVGHLMMILWQEKYLVLKVHLVHVQPFYSCFHHVSFASEWPTAHQGLVSDDILSLYQNTPKGTTNTKKEEEWI